MSDKAVTPIDIVLYCPKCGLQHIDAPEPGHLSGCAVRHKAPWNNPPHKSHLCAGCGHLWRPSDSPTNGVESTESGKAADTRPPLVYFSPAANLEPAGYRIADSVVVSSKPDENDVWERLYTANQLQKVRLDTIEECAQVVDEAEVRNDISASTATSTGAESSAAYHDGASDDRKRG